MTAAWLLAGLAALGVVIGAILGQSRSLSLHMAAAGGGLLSGISLFWLMPEIAETMGATPAIAIPVTVALGLWAADWKVLHATHALRRGFVGPLMAATALHSALDGWSIGAVAVQPTAGWVVLLGLALHKLPEGLALGWLVRNALDSTGIAIFVCTVVELLTVAGAWLEPKVAKLNISFFGTRPAAGVLMLVAGSFLFLGSHVVIADRKKAGIVPAFAAALAFTGLLAAIQHTGQ